MFEFPGFTAPGSPVWQSSHGCKVTDTNGKSYIDLAMGFGSLPFGHGFAMRAIGEHYNLAALPHGLGDLHGNAVRERASKLICEAAASDWHRDISPNDLRALVVHSGSEAVETALKTARLATGRSTVVSFSGAYHGTFGLALSVTHREDFRQPFAGAYNESAVRFAQYNTVPTLDESIACVIVEPIQGRAGVIEPDDAFLSGLRDECNRVGALLVIDSVLVGAGRIANGLVNSMVVPDIVCLGKSLGGGLPAGAVVTRADIATAAWGSMTGEPIHTATFLGHPLTCATIAVTLDRFAQLTDGQYNEITSAFTNLILAIAETSGFELRGRGNLWALETGQSRGGLHLANQLLDVGVIVVPSGPEASGVTFSPSLTITGEECHQVGSAFSSLSIAVPV